MNLSVNQVKTMIIKDNTKTERYTSDTQNR